MSFLGIMFIAIGILLGIISLEHTKSDRVGYAYFTAILSGFSNFMGIYIALGL